MRLTQPVAWLFAFAATISPLGAMAKTAADYYVRDLPGLPADGPVVKMHAGHIEVTPEHNGNMFFWHFQNQHIANKQRTVIWLNGGPGCSSEDGALMEIGPYRLIDDNHLVHNNGSWNEFANLLFVDNPVGTGFSYVDTDSYVEELEVMASQFITFLEKYFALFPEYERDDLYIAGESYAGQHIPYIAKAILDRNLNNPKNAWQLSGLLIGNGWISPIQYRTYAKFALHKNLVGKGSPEAEELEAMTQNCEHYLGKADAIDLPGCESILQKIMRLSKTDGKTDGCINIYDVRLRDSWPSCGMSWPPDLAYLNPYLRNPKVIQALHIDPTKNTGWQECKDAVGNAFRKTHAKPAVRLLPDIMKQVRLLLFSGADDLICNHFGTEDLINELEWNGAKGFEISPGNMAPRREWTFESEAAGFWQEARNLTYVLFYNASHMVPFDHPRRSRDMLDRFMGVDISSIGGEPSDSRIDGEKGLDTTVSDATNNTKTNEKEIKEKLQQAKWAAYQRSGEVALVFVSIAAALFGYFIWRQRRKGTLYSALRGEEASKTGFRRPGGNADLEASDFADASVDNMPLRSINAANNDHYGIGDDSDEDDEASVKDKEGKKPASEKPE